LDKPPDYNKADYRWNQEEKYVYHSPVLENGKVHHIHDSRQTEKKLYQY
jgi:hypothetical protein